MSDERIIETESPREYIEALQRNNRTLRASLITARSDLDDAYQVVAKVALERNELVEKLKTLEDDYKRYRDVVIERLANPERDF